MVSAVASDAAVTRPRARIVAAAVAMPAVALIAVAVTIFPRARVARGGVRRRTVFILAIRPLLGGARSRAPPRPDS